MHIHRVIPPQGFLRFFAKPLSCFIGIAPRAGIHKAVKRHIFFLIQIKRHARRQDAPHQIPDMVFGRNARHVTRRALEHDHMARLFGQLRHKGHRRRARTDDRDMFARIVKVFGPVLRVKNFAAKILAPLKGRRIAFLIFVIARAGRDKARDDLARGLVFLAGERQRPEVCLRREIGRRDFMAELHHFRHAIFISRVLHILTNAWPVCEDFIANPRAEIIAEGEHIGIAANTGIAEQIPCPAYGAARLNDGKLAIWKFCAVTTRRADPRQASPDDYHIINFAHRLLWHRRRNSQSDVSDQSPFTACQSVSSDRAAVSARKMRGPSETGVTKACARSISRS